MIRIGFVSHVVLKLISLFLSFKLYSLYLGMGNSDVRHLKIGRANQFHILIVAQLHQN